MARLISSRLVEGFWNCDKCGKEKILGRFDSCPSCGNRRNENTKYELLDKHNYVSEDEEKSIDRRPDWLCSYCSNLNRASFNNCSSCGASKTDSRRNYFENLEYKRKVEQEKREQNIQHDEKATNQESINQDNVIQKTSNFFKDNPIITKISIIFISIILVVLFIIGIINLFKPEIKTLKVTSFEWKSTISIEEYKTVNESDWSLLTGARLQYSNEEIYGYKSVFDHYETRTRPITKKVLVGYNTKTTYTDLGNGYFEENIYEVPVYDTITEYEEYQEAVYKEEPIYKTMYYYEIDKWVFKEKKTKTGEDKSPTYPDIALKDKERESSRSQTYFVNAKDEKNKKYKLSLSYEDWNSISIDQSVKFKIYLDNTAKIIKEE